MKAIRYVYFYLYSTAKKMGGANPKDSADLYLIWIISGIIVPSLAVITLNLIGKERKVLFFTILLILLLCIYKVIKKFVLPMIDLQEKVFEFEKESLLKRTFGYVISISLLFISPLFGLWLITLY